MRETGRIPEQYTKPEQSLAEKKPYRKLEILSHLQDMGLIEVAGEEKTVIDSDRFRQLGTEGIRAGKHIFSPEFLNTLRDVHAIDKKDWESMDRSKLVPRPVVSLPRSISELGKFYSEGDDSIIKPWEISGSANSIYKPIKLDSGEETSAAELRVAGILFGELKAQRDKQGRLEIWDGQRYQIFTTGLFKRLTGLNPVRKQGGKTRSFHHSGLGFVQKYLANLLNSGILRREDFKVQGGTTTSDVFNVSERRLNPKAPYVNFTTSLGHSAKYYIGREKLVGTPEKIDPETMRMQLLDSTLAGVIEQRHGKSTLKYIFDLLSDQDIEKKQGELLSQGLARKDLPQNVTVSAQEMKQRMRAYNVTDYVAQRSNETSRQYAERIARLSNVGFVIKTFQNFFSEAGVGVHKLPWSEQLVLADAIGEEKSKNRLVDFAKTYGINGVRSFLSVDLDRKLGQQILGLGEKGDPKIVAEIFKKYASIVDSVKMVESRCLQTFGKAFSAGEMNKIEESLLRKAKELLEGFDPAKADSLEAVNVIGQLEHINEEVLLFASTFKVASEGKPLDFSEIKGTEISIKDSGDLSVDDKKQMMEIYRGNRVKYEPKRLAETVRDFEGVLASSGKEFNLLTHNGELLAFIRFDQLPNGNLHAGSLNVRPEARNSQIGMALLRATLDKKAETHNIEAEAWSKLEMLKHYTGDFGFQITGEMPNYHGSEMYYKLFRPKKGQADRQEAA